MMVQIIMLRLVMITIVIYFRAARAGPRRRPQAKRGSALQYNDTNNSISDINNDNTNNNSNDCDSNNNEVIVIVIMIVTVIVIMKASSSKKGSAMQRYWSL